MIIDKLEVFIYSHNIDKTAYEVNRYTHENENPQGGAAVPAE